MSISSFSDLLFFFSLIDCDKKMDVGIIIDSSSSVRRLNFEKVKAFLVQLVDKLDVDPSMTHVGVIHYNHRSFLDWGLNSEIAQNSALLEQALMKLGYKPGGTRTDRAILKATNELMKDSEGMRPGIPHVILVLTDGKTSSRSIPYPKALEKAKVLRQTIVALTLTWHISPKFPTSFNDDANRIFT